MAPEQARNEAVDARADLFSLGCVLYRLATGLTPFPGETTMAVLISLAVDQPPGMQQLNPQLPPAFCRLVEWLLAKNPAQRPGSARVVIDALEAIEHDASAAALAMPAAQGSTSPDAHGTQALSVETPSNTPILPLAARAAPAPAGPTRVVNRPTPASVPAPPPLPARANTRRRWILIGLAAAVLGAIIIGLMSPPPRVGVLNLDASDEIVAQFEATPLRVRDRSTEKEFTIKGRTKHLPPGDYDVVADGETGLSIDPPGFSITRAQETTIRIAARVKPAPDDPDRGLTAWIAKTAALRGAIQAQAVQEKLKERNPNFQGPFEPRFSDDTIIDLRIDTKAVTDLSPLRALKQLGILHAVSSDPDAPERLADLTPLAGMGITELNLKQTRVTNLAPLGDLPSLARIDLELTPVSDLRPLQRCRKLASLNVGRTRIKDLAGLESLPLKLLSAERTPITSLVPLKSAPSSISIAALRGSRAWPRWKGNRSSTWRVSARR